jgi:hypothetical protein
MKDASRRVDEQECDAADTGAGASLDPGLFDDRDMEEGMQAVLAILRIHTHGRGMKLGVEDGGEADCSRSSGSSASSITGPARASQLHDGFCTDSDWLERLVRVPRLRYKLQWMSGVSE